MPENMNHCKDILRNTVLAALSCLMLLVLPVALHAQSEDLTVVVLINSTNTVDYNPSVATPGSYQKGPERYLVNLQVPYRLVDVSTTAAFDMSSVQLIVAGHNGLSPSAAWQAAIQAAVNNGTGFVNLDSNIAIGGQAHMLSIFGATGATVGANQTSVVVPAAVQSGGATPHYIAALQQHWAGDAAGDLVYNYHGNGVTVIPSNATLLTGASGTVVAEIGTDPLILATTYGKGRAVDFTTYDYMHPDRFGFVEGCDDLFWRSIVWAARKPFVLRGYPHMMAIQMDDNEVGVISRIPDMWNTTLTQPVAADGTGGPWTPQLNMQLSSLDDPGGERAQLIAAVAQNSMHASPHGLDYGSGGDLYWNLTVPTTDAQWLTNVASVATWKQGQGGSDTFPPFSRSIVGHYWDLSNNVGYELWNNLGVRYITAPQAPGVYYFTVPKTPAQRIPLGPYRTYEQPPLYTGDEEETFPFFFADDLVVNSVAGEPAETFFSFGSQVGLEAGRFTRPDAVWPSSQNGYSVAQSLNQWEYYMWRFWSGMTPVQIYTHDGDNLEYTTVSDRQTFITQLSQWMSTKQVYHTFMDTMGDYLRARNHSLLSTASLSSTALTLNYTGSATDADGHPIATKTYIFYGDDEGTLLSVPGFSSGGSFSFPNTQPATMQVTPGTLNFVATAGTSPKSQTIQVSDLGTGSFQWTATSNASWVTVSAASGTSNTPVQVSVNSSTLAVGTYPASITFTAPGVLNSPSVTSIVMQVAPSTASLIATPVSLTFNAMVGGAAPPSQSVAITNASLNSITWAASSDSPWLSASIAANGTPGTVTVSTNPAGLALGAYTGKVTISSAGAASIVIPVTFQLTGTIAMPSTTNLSAWTVSPLGNAAGWTSAGGSILYNGGGESQLYTGSSTWTNYTANLGLTLKNLSNYPGGFRVRVNPATGAGYALWLYPADHVIKLFSVVNWNISNGYTTLATVNNFLFDANPHVLGLSAQGSVISATYDGLQLFSVTDTTYASGLLALDPSNQPTSYNSVSITSSVAPVNYLSSAPGSMSFSAAPGAVAAAQSVTLSSSTMSVGWTSSSNAAWLTINPSSGAATPATLSVSASAVGLAQGTYSGTVTFTPATGTPAQLPVTLTVSSVLTGVIALKPRTIDLFSVVGSSPPAVSVAVQNTGVGSLAWTAVSSASWLTPSPAAASAPGTLTLVAATSGLGAGVQSALVTVASPNALNGSVTLPVNAHLGSLVFADAFNNGHTQWTASPLGFAANWSVLNNAYTYNGKGHTQQYAGSPSWTNYTVSTGFALSSLSDYPGGLRGRVNLSSGFAYAAWIYPKEGYIKLYRTSGWAIDTSPLTLLGQSPALAFDTSTHMLRLGFSGSTISVYYDNSLVITATDTALTSGAIALDVSSQPISFSNVSVLQ